MHKFFLFLKENTSVFRDLRLLFKMSESVEMKEFDFADMYDSCVWILIGQPGSGKSSFIENLVYYTRHKYPVARVWTGADDGYRKMCSLFGPLYVSNYFDNSELSKLIVRQKARVMENGLHSPGNGCINIIDDLTDDKKIFSTKEMGGLFKIGPQHWDVVTIVSSQYCIDLAPPLRKCTSYVAIFKETNPIDRKKLYHNFGGICGSEKDFYDIMDAITGDYTCLIIDNRKQSTKREDCLFWYKTKVITDSWTFGCKEYKDHADARYNTAYQEKI